MADEADDGGSVQCSRSDTERQLAAFLSDSNDSIQIVGATAAEQGLSSFRNNEAACKADSYNTVLYQRAHYSKTPTFEGGGERHLGESLSLYQ